MSDNENESSTKVMTETDDKVGEIGEEVDGTLEVEEIHTFFHSNKGDDGCVKSNDAVEDHLESLVGHENNKVRTFAANMRRFIHPDDYGDEHSSALTTTEAKALTIVNENNVAWVPATDYDEGRKKFVWDKNSLIQKPPHVRKVPKEVDASTTDLFSFHKLTNAIIQKTEIDLFGKGRPAKKYSEFPYHENSSLTPADNDYFILQRLQGANACAITRLTLKVRDDVNAGLRHSGLDELDENKVLYMIDYAILEPFSKQLLNEESYVPASVVVLSYSDEDKKFSPEAILYDRANRYVGAVKPDDSLQWEFGMMCARVSDWNAHELGSHLTLTHLVSEVAAVNAHRCLPKNHPIFQLLKPHFYHTLPLNANARAVLVPDIIAKKLTPWSFEQCEDIDSAIFNAWDFEEHYVPTELRRRGVDTLPDKVYPFGAVATRVWNRVREYVWSVLGELQSVITLSDPKKSIVDDYHIQQFCKSLQSEETGLPGFPDIDDEEELCDALTMIIYTASYQHSAVNYFQNKFMGYVPNAPSCLAKAPSADLSKLRPKSLLKALPTPRMASLSTAVLSMLSEHPQKNHRLTEFGPNVQWGNAAGHLRTMQKNLSNDLNTLQAEMGEGSVVPPTLITGNTLAQSILI